MADSLKYTESRLALRNQLFLSNTGSEKPSDFSINLRKQKRQECINRKRSQNKPSIILKDREVFLTITEIIRSGPTDLKFLEALTYLRNLYALDDKSLSFKLTKSVKLIEDLMKLLRSFSPGQEEFRLVLNCMCNLSSGPDYITEDLFSFGLDETCIQLLSHSQSDAWIDAVWCLSNLSVDKLSLRETMVKRGVLEIYIDKLNDHKDILLWAIRNILEGVQEIEKRVLMKLIKAIKQVIKEKQKDLLVQALWIFSILSDGNPSQVSWLIKSNVLKVLIKNLRSNSRKVLKPVLRTLRNFAAGTPEEVHKLLESNILELVYGIFNKTEDVQVRKYGISILTNLTSGTRTQIEEVVSHPIIIPAVACMNNGDSNIRKEAISIAFNIAKFGKVESVKGLVNVGVFKETKELLSAFLDPDLVLKVLETVYLVLNSFSGEVWDEVFNLFLDNGMLEILEKVSCSKNSRVQTIAVKIMKLAEKTEFDDN